ncbi:hypothetical protein ANANG_G00169530 [Anguilla anguilla]|uniref:C2H2-type domain-containing protein n=1 Tax=Anguilla anguilla TaxID=7936 RepID=A0A9D3M9Y2_ANGAN|nr:hypothetical protein ANANG_G00169530 [Anguilla anguilla]
MSGSMSDSVSVFQTQVASVLEVLLNVAVVEITKLFESGCVASEGSGVSGARTTPKTPLSVQDELRTRAESVLGNLRKHIHSAGIRVRDASDGEQAFPSAEGGAVFWEEGGEHTNASRTAVVKVEGPPSIAVECQLAGAQQWESSPSAAPPAGQSDTGGVVTATGPAESGAQGAVEEENSFPKQKCSEEDPRPQPTPEGSEQDARVTPVKEEPVTLPIPVKEGGPGRKGASPLPKDLRPHQRLHTGKRPCCFTACGNGVWRLQSRAHACQLCGKKFKRRKVLKRTSASTRAAALQLPALPQGLRPAQEPAAARALPHRRAAARCARCGKGFRLRANLKSHLRFHTGAAALRLPVLRQALPRCPQPAQAPGRARGRAGPPGNGNGGGRAVAAEAEAAAAARRADRQAETP